MISHQTIDKQLIDSIISNPKQFQHKLAEKLDFKLKEFSKNLYLCTKAVLEEGKHKLNSNEKTFILNEYIKIWAESQCKLDISDTEYGGLYEQSSFGKYRGSYNKHVPMVAGFDFEGVTLGMLHYSDLIFLSNNFKDADFSKTELPYAHFENCDLSGIKTNHSNLNQCSFIKCNLREANLEGAGLSEVRFEYSDITNMKQNKQYHNPWTWKCVDDNVENKERISSEINDQLHNLEVKANEHETLPEQG